LTTKGAGFTSGLACSATFIPFLLVVFTVYQLVEFIVKKEPKENLIGDFTELIYGYFLMCVVGW